MLGTEKLRKREIEPDTTGIQTFIQLKGRHEISALTQIDVEPSDKEVSGYVPVDAIQLPQGADYLDIVQHLQNFMGPQMSAITLNVGKDTVFDPTKLHENPLGKYGPLYLQLKFIPFFMAGGESIQNRVLGYDLAQQTDNLRNLGYSPNRTMIMRYAQFLPNRDHAILKTLSTLTLDSTENRAKLYRAMNNDMVKIAQRLGANIVLAYEGDAAYIQGSSVDMLYPPAPEGMVRDILPGSDANTSYTDMFEYWFIGYKHVVKENSSP